MTLRDSEPDVGRPDAATALSPSAEASNRIAITARSVGLGLIGVVVICGVTPFNNFVAANTFLVGNLMPVAAALGLAVMVLGINGLLRWMRSGSAFSPAELAVAFSMMLVSCTLPSSGLMRYLPGSLVSPYWLAAANPANTDLLKRMELGGFLFPSFLSDDLAQRSRDPIVRDFMQHNTEASGLAAVPWAAWVTPAVSWGLFALMLYSAVIGLVVLVRRQWAENERIRFPLAEVYGSLLEAPAPGRLFPPVVYSKLFMFAAGAVFLLHMSNGVKAYVPLWPSIDLRFNIGGLMSESPWVHATYGLKACTLMFTVVGVCYFVPTKVAFSLVFFFFLFNVTQISLGPTTGGVSLQAQRDQTWGAVLVFAGTMAYTGRHHWARVLRSMVGWRRQGDDTGRDLPYTLAAWLLVSCVVGLVVFLVLAGAPLMTAVAIVAVVLLFYIVIARIVAETGLIYVQLHALAPRPWTFAAELPGPLSSRSTPTGYYLLSHVTSVFATDNRENSLVYAQSAVATVDRVEREQGKPLRRRRYLLPLCLIVALMVGFVTAGASHLICQYNFSATLDVSGQFPINPWGTVGAVQTNILDNTRTLAAPDHGFVGGHNGFLHAGVGAAIAAVVAVCHLSFAAFPFHPIGVVMAYSFPLQHIWFSVLIGWALKSVLLRFGGASFFYQAKPFFLGLIFGETAAIATWLMINMAVRVSGTPHRPVNILLGAIGG